MFLCFYLKIVHPCYHAGNLAELDELTNGCAVLGIARGAFWEFLGIDKQRKPITDVSSEHARNTGATLLPIIGYGGLAEELEKMQ